MNISASGKYGVCIYLKEKMPFCNALLPRGSILQEQCCILVLVVFFQNPNSHKMQNPCRVFDFDQFLILYNFFLSILEKKNVCTMLEISYIKDFILLQMHVFIYSFKKL